MDYFPSQYKLKITYLEITLINNNPDKPLWGILVRVLAKKNEPPCPYVEVRFQTEELTSFFKELDTKKMYE